MTELIRQPETDPAKFERVCAGKLAHETEAAALAALELERKAGYGTGSRGAES